MALELDPGVGVEAGCLRESAEGIDGEGELRGPSSMASTAALIDASVSVRVGYADVRARRRGPAMRVNCMVNRWRSLMCKPLLTA